MLPPPPFHVIPWHSANKLRQGKQCPLCHAQEYLERKLSSFCHKNRVQAGQACGGP